jgi:DNA-nicking Smr family endonuclease
MAPEVIDLHDHTVQQARERVTALLSSKPSGSSLRLIVGRGNNSPDGVPRIKPAIERLLNDHPRVGAENFEFDGGNEGAFNVNIL